MINVTKTFLPDRKKFDRYVDQIWKNNWLTNHGPLVLKLERRLKKKFKVKHLFLVNNGTIALQIAIKTLGFTEGEIITTPFSYVATTSSIVWEGFKPVFVDIEPKTLTIDPDKIESAITNKTRAIMAVHIYGIPCNVEQIEKIAKKHKLKVIYDTAHAFGVKYKGKSILKSGDISILSFHATKLFHTIEGGAIITNNNHMAKKIGYMRNFGHKTPTSFQGLGINGKMNEFCAAMGLSILPSINKIIAKRKQITVLYDQLLKRNSNVSRPQIPKLVKYNYAYYPIIFKTEALLKKAVRNLKGHNIHPRRYFYPSLNTLSYVKKIRMPISENMSERVLCLPLFIDLSQENVKLICNLI